MTIPRRYIERILRAYDRDGRQAATRSAQRAITRAGSARYDLAAGQGQLHPAVRFQQTNSQNAGALRFGYS
jgi:hypothetical protein